MLLNSAKTFISPYPMAALLSTLDSAPDDPAEVQVVTTGLLGAIDINFGSL